MMEKQPPKRQPFDSKQLMKRMLGEDTTAPFDDTYHSVHRGGRDDRYWQDRRPEPDDDRI